MSNNKLLVKEDIIASRIFFIRGEKVILDFDLAQLYGVQTKVLKQAVKRNMERFPADFMFILSNEEFSILRSQPVTSSLPQGKSGWGGTRYAPFAFTEQGVAMLSSVLKSKKAVNVNISIMRAFVHLRKLIDTNRELAEKINSLERKLNEKTEKFDKDIMIIFEAIRQLMQPPQKPRTKVGYKIQND